MHNPSLHAPPWVQNGDLTGYLYRLAHGKAQYDPDVDKALADVHFRLSVIADDFQAYRATEEAPVPPPSEVPAHDQSTTPVTLGQGRHANVDLFLADWQDRGPFHLCSGLAMIRMDRLDTALDTFLFYVPTSAPLRIEDKEGLVIANSTGAADHHYAPRLPAIPHDPKVYPAKRREQAFLDAWGSGGLYEVLASDGTISAPIPLKEALALFHAWTRGGTYISSIYSNGPLIAYSFPGKADLYWGPDGRQIALPGRLHEAQPPTHSLVLEQEIFRRVWQGKTGMYVLHTPTSPKGTPYDTLDAVLRNLGRVTNLGTSTASILQDSRLVATKCQRVYLYQPDGKLLDLPALSAHLNATTAPSQAAPIDPAAQRFCSIWQKFGPFAVAVHRQEIRSDSAKYTIEEALVCLRNFDVSGGGVFAVRCGDQIVADRYYGTVRFYDPAGKPVDDPALVEWMNRFYRPSGTQGGASPAPIDREIWHNDPNWFRRVWGGSGPFILRLDSQGSLTACVDITTALKTLTNTPAATTIYSATGLRIAEKDSGKITFRIREYVQRNVDPASLDAQLADVAHWKQTWTHRGPFEVFGTGPSRVLHRSLDIALRDAITRPYARLVSVSDREVALLAADSKVHLVIGKDLLPPGDDS